MLFRSIPRTIEQAAGRPTARDTGSDSFRERALLRRAKAANSQMAPVRDPDPQSVRSEVMKTAKKLQEQKELLFRRLFASQIRLKFLDGQLRENGKNYRKNYQNKN